jgi:hypothetical protein
VLTRRYSGRAVHYQWWSSDTHSPRFLLDRYRRAHRTRMRIILSRSTT